MIAVAMIAVAMIAVTRPPPDASTGWQRDGDAVPGSFDRPWQANRIYLPEYGGSFGLRPVHQSVGLASCYAYPDNLRRLWMTQADFRVDLLTPSGVVFPDHRVWAVVADTTSMPAPFFGPDAISQRYPWCYTWPERDAGGSSTALMVGEGRGQLDVLSMPGYVEADQVPAGGVGYTATERAEFWVYRERNAVVWRGHDWPVGVYRRIDPGMLQLPDGVMVVDKPTLFVADLFQIVVAFDLVVFQQSAERSAQGTATRDPNDGLRYFGGLTQRRPNNHVDDIRAFAFVLALHGHDESPGEIYIPCDYTGDGDVSVADFFGFVGLFLAGDLEADFDGSGVVTNADFFAYLDEFLLILSTAGWEPSHPLS